MCLRCHKNHFLHLNTWKGGTACLAGNICLLWAGTATVTGRPRESKSEGIRAENYQGTGGEKEERFHIQSSTFLPSLPEDDWRGNPGHIGRGSGG